jgi:ribosomal protein S18 acetylase RimI-like enzyme
MLVLGTGLTQISATLNFGMLDVAGERGLIGHGLVYPALSAMVIARTELGARALFEPLPVAVRHRCDGRALYDLSAIAGLLGHAPMFVVRGEPALVGSLYFLAVDPDARIRACGRRLEKLGAEER